MDVFGSKYIIQLRTPTLHIQPSKAIVPNRINNVFRTEITNRVCKKKIKYHYLLQIMNDDKNVKK